MGHVLLVEDDNDIAEIVRDLLEMEGYDVLVVGNGQEALHALEHTSRPCVILLDLMMPVMNGWQFLETLRHGHRFSEVPVVVVTASPAPVSGADGLLRKPFDLDELVRTVSRFCAGASSLSPSQHEF